MMNESWVLIETAGESVGAELARGSLEADGIAVVVRERDSLGAAMSVYSFHQNRVYDLYVAPEDAEDARALIAAYGNGRTELSDAELDAAASAAYDERV